MGQKIISSVVMLPTNDKSTNLLECIKTFNLSDEDQAEVGELRIGFGMYSVNEFFIKQHLYFTTNESIRINDHVLHESSGRILQVGSITPTNIIEKEYHINGIEVLIVDCVKIVASTDGKLNLNLIGSDFVENYVSTRVGKIILEYNDPVCQCDTFEKEFNCTYSFGENCVKPHNGDFYGLKFKVDESGFIVTKLIDEKKRMDLQYCVSLFAAERGLTSTAKEMKLVNEWVDEWVAENL